MRHESKKGVGQLSYVSIKRTPVKIIYRTRAKPLGLFLYPKRRSLSEWKENVKGWLFWIVRTDTSAEQRVTKTRDCSLRTLDFLSNAFFPIQVVQVVENKIKIDWWEILQCLILYLFISEQVLILLVHCFWVFGSHFNQYKSKCHNASYTIRRSYKDIGRTIETGFCWTIRMT